MDGVNNKHETEPLAPPQEGTHPTGLRVTLRDGRAFESRGSATVGRASSHATTVQIALDDPTVSAFHVDLTPTHDGVEVEDVKHSRNGTWYHGALLRKGVVPNGSVVTVGHTDLYLQLVFDHAAEPPREESFGELIGNTPAMFKAFRDLRRLAPTRSAILLRGATGTGKELAAKAIHACSGRKGNYVVVNCAQLTTTVAEDAICGHVRGAFTDAKSERKSPFEVADGGTIFLDEIGDLPLEIQPKLLRVLESHHVTRMGESKERPVDVRVLSATLHDLRAKVNDGSFRADLYHRLVHTVVWLPPLEDRRLDIEVIARRFLIPRPEADGCLRSNGYLRSITRPVLDALMARNYPGNVRELRHFVELLDDLAKGPTITMGDYDEALRYNRGECGEGDGHSASPGRLPWKDHKSHALQQIERAYFSSLLKEMGGVQTRVAKAAGINRSTLQEICERCRLFPDEKDGAP